MVIMLENIPSLILKFFPCQRGIFPQGSVRLSVIKHRALSTSPSSLFPSPFLLNSGLSSWVQKNQEMYALTVVEARGSK